MPPKIPRAWPQDVARHLALYGHIHGTEEAAKYAAESAGHSSEELQVGFTPSLPPSTFKKLFGASKARAKAKQLPIDLSGEDEYLPSASVPEPSTPPLSASVPEPMDPPKRVPKEPPYPPPPVMVDYSSGDDSEDWGGWTAAGYNVKQDDSAGSVPEPAGVPAPKTPPLDLDPEWQWRNLEFGVEASLKGKKKNKGVKRTLGLWQRMEELKRQGLWVGPDEPNKEAKKARVERDGKGKGK